MEIVREEIRQDIYKDLQTEDVFNDPEFSDCQIHVGDKIFHVSKFLLTLKSDVFRACFRSETKEKQSGIIKIDDLDSELVEVMLKFMYGIDLKNLEEIAHDLYVVAERYNVRGLMKHCLDIMIENLYDPSNLSKYLELSFKMNLPELRQTALEFAANQLRINNDNEAFLDHYLDELETSFKSSEGIPRELIKELLAQDKKQKCCGGGCHSNSFSQRNERSRNSFISGNPTRQEPLMSNAEFDREFERIVGREPDYANRFLQIATIEQLERMVQEAKRRFSEARLQRYNPNFVNSAEDERRVNMLIGERAGQQNRLEAVLERARQRVLLRQNANPDVPVVQRQNPQENERQNAGAPARGGFVFGNLRGRGGFGQNLPVQGERNEERADNFHQRGRGGGFGQNRRGGGFINQGGRENDPQPNFVHRGDGLNFGRGARGMRRGNN